MLVDSHCHLNFDGLKDRLPDVLKAARDNGVEGMLTVCSYWGDFPELLDIANKYGLWTTIGIHPYDSNVSQTDDELRQVFIDNVKKYRNKILAIGECGLDYFNDPTDEEKQIQKRIFQLQVELALELDIPLMVHTREAGDDTYQVLKDFVKRGGRGVIHCFTGLADEAKNYIDLGFYIGATGIITFKKAQDLRDIFANIPLDRLFVETDCPYLTPVPYRGKLNEPCYLKYVAEELARIKSVSFETISEITTKNFETLYGVKVKPLSL